MHIIPYPNDFIIPAGNKIVLELKKIGNESILNKTPRMHSPAVSEDIIQSNLIGS